jgi:hypothetical protein
MSEGAKGLSSAALFKVILEARGTLDPRMPNTDKMEALRQAVGRRWPQASPADVANALDQLKQDHPGALPPVKGL